MSESKTATPATWVDPEDAPELGDEFFQRADLYRAGKLVRRGRPQGSVKPDARQQITLRMDPEALARWRASGAGWQTRAAALLAKAAP